MGDSRLVLDGMGKLHFHHPATKTIGRVFETSEVAEGMVIGHNGEMLPKQIVPEFLRTPDDGQCLQLCDHIVGFGRG